MEKFLDPETKTPMTHDPKMDVKIHSLPFLYTLGVPKGFKRIKWVDVKENQEVYIWGSIGWFNKTYIPQAYGPHWVYNKDRRMLRNRANRVFMHYPEELLVREELQ